MKYGKLVFANARRPKSRIVRIRGKRKPTLEEGYLDILFRAQAQISFYEEKIKDLKWACNMSAGISKQPIPYPENNQVTRTSPADHEEEGKA